MTRLQSMNDGPGKFARERDACSNINQCYRSMLMGVARTSFHLSTADAEDLTQDLLLSLLSDAGRTLDGFRGDSAFAAYLRAIMRHRCLGFVQRSRARLERESAGINSPTCNLESQVLVRQAIRLVNARDRLMLDLVFFQGCTYSEISRWCGAPENTVASWINRAKSRLRRVLLDSERREASPRFSAPESESAAGKQRKQR